MNAPTTAPMNAPATDHSPAAAKSLMLSRRFAPLFWCQFFSAFNDNFLKNALVFLILFKIGGARGGVADHAGRRRCSSRRSSSCPALGGEMADRYDKAMVAQRLKLVEIGVALHRGRRLRAALGADPVRRAVPASA